MMDYILTEPEIRVLGSLVEKEITTPEYYPLSMNALINACNQKTNREPVVSYTECIVSEALDRLSEKGLVVAATGRGERVTKYENYFAYEFKLSPQETAVMCVLMLRGPQTAGEIRGRTDRLYTFEEISDVEEVLEGLASREEPLVKKLPRQPGRKESRYTHMLAGDVAEDFEESQNAGSNGDICGKEVKIQELEERIAALRTEFDEIKQQFLAFKTEFE